MSEDEKRKADILVELYRQAYQNFERRRTYEWKLSLAIWTALAVFIAIAIRREASTFNFALAAVALAAILLHWFFIGRVKLANDVDKRKAELYEHELNQLVGIHFGPNGENDYMKAVTNAISLVIDDKGFRRWVGKGRWAIVMHVGFTILLTIAGLIVVLASRGSQQTPGSRQLQSKVIGWGSTSIDLDGK